MGLDITLSTKKHEIYFRKHNYLMAWVEKTTGNEIENCKDIDLTKDQLESLLASINEVLADHGKAPSLLPTQSGFFFGSTEYDEWYFEDLEYAKEHLTGMLADMADEEIATFNAWW